MIDELERGERPAHSRIALVMMLIATACFVGMSAFVKLLREDGFGTSEVIFWRSAPGLVWILVELRIRGVALRPNAPGPIIGRSLAGLTAMAGYVYALRVLTMIESSVLHLLQPVFVAVLAPAMLGERLKRRAVAALMIALLGALLVIRPDRGFESGVPIAAVLAGVAAALCSAIAHVLVRRATARDRPELVVFWFTVCVTSVGLVVSLVEGRMLAGLPAGVDLGAAGVEIAGMAGLGLAGQLLMTRAYGRAAAPVVAIVAYAAIPLSMSLDWLSWGVRPGLDALLGSVAMIVAGALLASRPRRSSSQAGI